VLVPRIRQFLQPFMRLDKFAIQRAGGRYPVCSLYLDSADLKLYQQTVCGEKNRFKLRVRTYSDDDSLPVFLEVKCKLNSIVHKRRAEVPRDHAARMLNREVTDVSALTPSSRQDADYFYHHLGMIEARPVVRVKYMREAYEALGNEPVRVTIDTDLMHAITLAPEFRRTPGRWTATPLDGSILEIKFTERFPWWVQDFIRSFGLLQRAVPKYIWSVDHMLLEGRESTLAMAGVSLPPLRRT
jgi:SPX domain protein involved in polyphosphate accumulation